MQSFPTSTIAHSYIVVRSVWFVDAFSVEHTSVLDRVVVKIAPRRNPRGRSNRLWRAV
jgi:hypothetical protein